MSLYKLIETYWKKYLPKAPSYNRFVELIEKAMLPLISFISSNNGKHTGLYFVDATKLYLIIYKSSIIFLFYGIFTSFYKESLKLKEEGMSFIKLSKKFNISVRSIANPK